MVIQLRTHRHTSCKPRSKFMATALIRSIPQLQIEISSSHCSSVAETCVFPLLISCCRYLLPPQPRQRQHHQSKNQQHYSPPQIHVQSKGMLRVHCTPSRGRAIPDQQNPEQREQHPDRHPDIKSHCFSLGARKPRASTKKSDSSPQAAPAQSTPAWQASDATSVHPLPVSPSANTPALSIPLPGAA